MEKHKKGNGQNVKCCAIIVAAGESKRMGNTGNKQYIDILGCPLLSYTIQPFEECDLVDNIIIVTREEDIMYCTTEIVNENGFEKVKKIVAGGKERQDSVYKGLCEVDEDTDIVIVHDGARPLIQTDEIENSIYECIDSKAVTLGVKARDTVKEIDDEGYISKTLNRESLWTIQTPQTFDYKILTDAYNKAIADNFTGTDDSILVERMGYKVKIVEGRYDNIKVTTMEDISIVEGILQNRF
jgi:2-C-methyl-D-erythritol 4-phosphate cytidylyltransferase